MANRSIVRIVVVAIFLVLAMLLGMLGHDWIVVGYGLHPMLAFPLAIISLAVVGTVLWAEYRDHINARDAAYINGGFRAY